MDDAALVCGLERIDELSRDRQRVAQRQTPGGPGRLRGSSQHVLQRLAFDELHHDGGDAVRVLDAVNRGDVRVIQRGADPGLALEPGQAIGVGAMLR